MQNIRMIRIILILAIVGLSIPIANTNVKATALSLNDFDRNPEAVCVTHGDKPGMKPVCDWIDVCDDSGTVQSTDEFCTGQAVRNIPYPPGGCPEGYYSEEDDESGLCYSIEEGCRSENLIMNKEQTSCSQIVRTCQEEPYLDRCTVTRSLGVPENEAPWNVCEPSVPDHCFPPWVARHFLNNGTEVEGVNLNCRDVNATGFRVTIDDIRRHEFDSDYDGLGCEAKEDIGFSSNESSLLH
jgi:hypothetical protein